ncbi:uncharacterized protein LOC117739336 isoform X2 [Cyclopterus lumpus]|uniref:uncharacterized protein LOC117739336 isoform X2 n=1 Tax=Cyclopterus lumpus TaxID=8103 RepID=UPI001486C515|nr:uncharacterized protein LOC117739336 isoform X2 [Cyclopterus lumpus]
MKGTNPIMYRRVSQLIRNLSVKKMDIVSWSVLTYGFLQLGSAWSIGCTASPSSPFSDQTTYSISDDSRAPDVTGSDCEYSWANDNYVLANYISSNPELVVNNSINDLITPKCFDIIIYTRNCISEGIGHRALCKPNCTLVALVRSQKQKGCSTGASPNAFLLLKMQNGGPRAAEEDTGKV